MRTVLDAQEERIKTIVGGDDGSVSDKTIQIFCEYLKAHLKLPCEVTGIEDFRWEEPYVLGGWSKREYEQLKKTQPSFRDRYQLLAIKTDRLSEWALAAGQDLTAHVHRVGDDKEFYLGLSELRATDKKSTNYQLLDDYAVWFVNSR